MFCKQVNIFIQQVLIFYYACCKILWLGKLKIKANYHKGKLKIRKGI